MCLILFAHEAHPEYRLVLAANRDEFYDRPTAPAARWEDAPVIAGRDLRAGGTWMGVTPEGRWAALTNFRDPPPWRPAPVSRGRLVAEYLRGDVPPEAYLASLRPRAGEFGGFNLLAADGESLHWFSNRGGGEGRAVEPGVHGLSNHLLDTPWPKVTRGKAALARLLESADSLGPDALLELLLDRTYAADHELPETGVGVERERVLSSLFIAGPEYGTRSSTALLIGRDGRALLVERTYDRGGPEHRDVRHELRVE